MSVNAAARVGCSPSPIGTQANTARHARLREENRGRRFMGDDGDARMRGRRRERQLRLSLRLIVKQEEPRVVYFAVALLVHESLPLRAAIIEGGGLEAQRLG